MEENMKLRHKIHDLSDEIYNDVHHGECFYESDMLNEFCSNLDKMKELALKYYNSNMEEE